MRAPAFGAATTDLYTAAIDMCGWADQHGCLAAVLGDHHGSEDGYLPSPLILASAIAARTERLMISLVAVILPFYDPVRLGEEIAVLDIISKVGRHTCSASDTAPRNSSTSVSIARCAASLRMRSWRC